MDGCVILTLAVLSGVGLAAPSTPLPEVTTPFESAPCPMECTCHDAPLYDTPFVHTWLRAGALHRTLPQLDANEILDDGAIAAAHGPATDAGVDMTRRGLHATCALYPDTDLTNMLHHLPSDTMVLSILQAAGSNHTVIEGDQLASLGELLALHIEGFVQHKPFQRIPSDSRLPQEGEDPQQESTLDNAASTSLSMAMADDALQSLVNLEILDLQFVRLISKEESFRLRRHTLGPISTTTMIDLPLKNFLRYAGDLNVAPLPNDLQNKNVVEEAYDDDDEEEEEDEEEEMVVEETNGDDEAMNFYEEAKYALGESYDEGVVDEVSVVLLNSTKESDDLVPYTVYKTDRRQRFLAPFASQASLKYLRIAHARLDFIGPELLEGLTNLHTFFLEYNEIRVLPDEVFSSTPNIKHLSIAHNSILSLGAKNLRGLKNLKSLDLEYNKFTIIGPGTFPFLPRLQKLHLVGNPLKHILPDSFMGINSTETLEIGSEFESTEIHNDAFRHLSNLKKMQILNISSASFKEGIFSGVPQLEELVLHGNISAIDYDAFTSIPYLVNLDISHCELSRVSLDAFFGLTQLISLDMSHNKLDELNPGIFDHLSSLTELYLQHNQLTTLPVGIFTPLRLKVLRLNHNPWECSCNLLQLHPTVTNSVVQKGYQLCKGDSKLTSVCDTVADRMVFDTRMAPRCYSPLQFRNKDVYSVASRYLKCSKFHWDPMHYTEKLEEISEYPEKKTTPNSADVSTGVTRQTTPPQHRMDDPDALEDSRRLAGQGWRPLADYTPVPLQPLDLLSIAERQMLEEAKDETAAPTLRSPSTYPTLQDGTTPASKEEQKRRLAESRAQYRANKDRIKQKLRLQRAREVQRMLKNSVWNNNS